MLDPFAGSGTSIVSAHKYGFKAIGFENVDKYVDYANNRILKNYYDSGKWISTIIPHECEICKELYNSKESVEFEQLDEESVEHLAQLLYTE